MYIQNHVSNLISEIRHPMRVALLYYQQSHSVCDIVPELFGYVDATVNTKLFRTGKNKLLVGFCLIHLAVYTGCIRDIAKVSLYIPHGFSFL